MQAKDWIDWIGFVIQALLLAILSGTASKLDGFRIVSAGQLEALQTLCLTFIATPREGADSVLDMGGTRGTLVLDFNEGWVMLLNIGTGPAVNIEYRFTPSDDARSEPDGYVSFMGPGVRASIPVPRGILQGHELECSLQYGGRRRISKEIRDLIFRMVTENPTGGECCISTSQGIHPARGSCNSCGRPSLTVFKTGDCALARL